MEVATNEMKKAVLTEKKFREENPYHVLQRTNKTIRVLEGRLEQGDYVSPQEKMLMQNELREQVKKESTRIQVTPSFLSFADMGLIRDLDKLGDSAGYSSALREIKGKYGDESFFDYILPQISKIEGMSEVGVFASFIRDLQLSDTVSQAIAKNKENLEVVKTLIPKEGPTVGSDQYWANIWDEDRGIFWDGPINTNMEFLNGHIQDVTQATGRNRARYTSGAMKAAKSLALHYLASGMEQEPKDALERATRTLIEGIGQPVEVGDRKTITPPQYPLNALQNEAMMDILRDPNFLAREVVPNVAITPALQNFATQVGDTPQEVLRENFSSEDRVHWHFSERGLHPVIPHHVTLGAPIGIRGVTGEPFLLEYDQLPKYVVEY